MRKRTAAVNRNLEGKKAVYVNRPNLKSLCILKLMTRWTQCHDCSGALKPASLIETSRQNKRIEWQTRLSEFISG
jgi:hypothetical protein